MEVQTEFERSIAQMYDAFKSVKKPVELEIHTPYITQAQVDVLLTTPLTELSWEELERYEYSAPSLLGGWEDFNYFLPRLMELYLRGEVPPRELCSKIGKTNLLTIEQRMALQDALLSAWQIELLRHPWTESKQGPEEFIACATVAKMSISIFLKRWLATDHIHARGYLGRFISRHLPAIASNRNWAFMMSAGSDDGQAIQDVANPLLHAWCFRPEVRRQIEQFIEESKDHTDLNELRELAEGTLMTLESLSSNSNFVEGDPL